MIPESFVYITVDIATIVICFLASFHPRIRFHEHFVRFLISATVVAIPFILWDIWFTEKGVWWFQDRYLLGPRIAGLPIEEVLFFYCIPFACVFTYFCIDKFFSLSWANAWNNILVFVMLIVGVLFFLLHMEKMYTSVTSMVWVLVMVYLHFIARREWIGQATLVYGILMLGFFPVNGVLTGFGLESPVVNYNPAHHLGYRMITIPVEDVVYGYCLFLLNLYVFEWLGKRMKKIDTPDVRRDSLPSNVISLK